MQGEFRGDFTRDSFNPTKHFSRVLAQQGRVQLDADWNEQAAILLHYLQRLAANLIGPHGGNGFEILPVKDNNTLTGFTIGSGNYYVDGILCENEKYIQNNAESLLAYYAQPDYPIEKDTHKLPNFPFLIYLDVWERHISYIEDKSIREVALNGLDTATRAKVIWQVKVSDTLEGVAKVEDINSPAPNETETRWEKLVKTWQPSNRGMLKAKGKQKASDDTSPCIISPEARYQGAENHLYRVEVHRGGTIEAGATFKWSRENSSIAVPVEARGDKTLIIDSAGREAVLGLSKGQWVELTDDTHELLGIPGTLVQIVNVEGNVLIVDVDKAKGALDLAQFPSNPKLRRWDYQGKDPKNGNLQLSTADNALLIKEGKDSENWLPLEDGIQIQFQPGATYRTGDYWLIPARTATGDILWQADPTASNQPAALPPHGVEHHYAPLAVIFSAEGEGSIGNCRKTIKFTLTE
ncbi:MAG TPA: DUF6519 domain-containing protein [Trichocoleus sp.]|jgi:hypothetical protein